MRTRWSTSLSIRELFPIFFLALRRSSRRRSPGHESNRQVTCSSGGAKTTTSFGASLLTRSKPFQYSNERVLRPPSAIPVHLSCEIGLAMKTTFLR